MAATVLSDLNQMSNDEIIMAMSSIISTQYWDKLASDEKGAAELEEVRRLIDELERRSVVDKYLR